MNVYELLAAAKTCTTLGCHCKDCPLYLTDDCCDTLISAMAEYIKEHCEEADH